MFAISLATSFTVESAVSLESLFLQATIAKAEIRIKNKFFISVIFRYQLHFHKFYPSVLSFTFGRIITRNRFRFSKTFAR